MRDTLAQFCHKRQAVNERGSFLDSILANTSHLKRALAAAEEPQFVESSAQLEQAVHAWRESEVLGLDTEFVRERTFRADLGLVQISDGARCWLIDPVALGDLDPLADFLRESPIPKVIHSGSEDMEVLFHRLGAVPNALADSQIACAMLGQSLQLGYHHAVDWLFGVEIDKDHTRSNWLRRPLSAGQLRYAALDVVLLPAMMKRLRAELEQLCRWTWLQEDVERMIRNSTRDVEPELAWARIGGAGSLDQAERAVLCALAAWRERTALQKNIARGFVVSDRVLLSMARQRPDSIAELKQIENAHPKAVDRHGDEWLALMRRASSAPPVPPLPQLTRPQRKLLNAMRTRVSATANSLNVDAALLASRKQLERLIFMFSESGSVPERFSGWRKDVITANLLQIPQS
jgi:ribonuclease D